MPTESLCDTPTSSTRSGMDGWARKQQDGTCASTNSSGSTDSTDCCSSVSSGEAPLDNLEFAEETIDWAAAVEKEEEEERLRRLEERREREMLEVRPLEDNPSCSCSCISYHGDEMQVESILFAVPPNAPPLADVFSSACCETSSSSSVSLGPAQCSGPHDLTSFTARDGNYQCGGCERIVPCGTIMMGCKNCPYDVCPVCTTQGQRPPLPAPPATAPVRPDCVDDEEEEEEEEEEEAATYDKVPTFATADIVCGGDLLGGGGLAIHPVHPDDVQRPPTSYGHDNPHGLFSKKNKKRWKQNRRQFQEMLQRQEQVQQPAPSSSYVHDPYLVPEPEAEPVVQYPHPAPSFYFEDSYSPPPFEPHHPAQPWDGEPSCYLPLPPPPLHHHHYY